VNRIYLAIGPDRAAVIVCRDPSDIDLAGLATTFGGPVDLHEVGIARPETPPGPLLIGDASEVNRWRPIGKKIEMEANP